MKAAKPTATTDLTADYFINHCGLERVTISYDLNVAQTEALLADAVERGVPVLGLCLGGQLLAEATGGRVELGPTQEIGLAYVQRTIDGLSDPVISQAVPSVGVDIPAALADHPPTVTFRRPAPDPGLAHGGRRGRGGEGQGQGEGGPPEQEGEGAKQHVFTATAAEGLNEMKNFLSRRHN